jgi:hypothetical protein
MHPFRGPRNIAVRPFFPTLALAVARASEHRPIGSSGKQLE